MAAHPKSSLAAYKENLFSGLKKDIDYNRVKPHKNYSSSDPVKTMRYNGVRLDIHPNDVLKFSFDEVSDIITVDTSLIPELSEHLYRYVAQFVVSQIQLISLHLDDPQLSNRIGETQNRLKSFMEKVKLFDKAEFTNRHMGQ
jgi:hypothetical protein